MKKISRILLPAIIFLALFLRLYKLSQVPPRLTVDELSIGYNAYSILKTGADEWGKRFPLVFKAFGDYKQPAYIYSVVPLLKIFDLSPIAVRLPSAIAGTLTVIGVYLLSSVVFNKKRLSLMAAFIAAVSPWAVKISRIGFESNLALCFYIFGLYYLIKSLKDKSKKSAILAGILLALPFYTYIAFRLVIGLMLIYLGLKWIFSKRIKSILLYSLISFSIVLIPLTKHLTDTSARARFTQVSIFNDPGVKLEVDEKRTYCYLLKNKTLLKTCYLVFNKYQVFGFRFAKNYIQSFSPTFLFIEGGVDAYLNPEKFGEFFLFLAPFYFFGFFWLFTDKNKSLNIIKAATLFGAVPASLVSAPQIVRSSSLMPFICIIIAVGLEKTFKVITRYKRKNVFMGVFLAILLFSSVRYYTNYLFIYPVRSAYSFYGVDKEVALFLKEKESTVDKIYVQQKFSEPHIFQAFYQKWDPSWYQRNVKRLPADSFGFERPYKFDKYEFGKNQIYLYLCQNKKEKVLYLTDQAVKLPTLPEMEFYDFTKVNLQSKIFDINALRVKLGEDVNKYCNN